MKKYENGIDNRPDPKPRKRPQLWQAYLLWDELVKMRMRHTLRLSSIDAGKSNLDGPTESLFIEEMNLDNMIELKKKIMSDLGAELMPDVWQWITSIRGLGAGGLAAQLLAQIDDITSFANVSKLWRFSGYAVIDGERERPKAGETLHYNARLKSIVFLIVDQFIRQQTTGYVEIYYAEKERQRKLHPMPENGKYSDGHIHAMAMRKTGKIFLQHLWLMWREAEGLPTNEPYAIAVLGHSDYIKPSHQ